MDNKKYTTRDLKLLERVLRDKITHYPVNAPLGEYLRLCNTLKKTYKLQAEEKKNVAQYITVDWALLSTCYTGSPIL